MDWYLPFLDKLARLPKMFDCTFPQILLNETPMFAGVIPHVWTVTDLAPGLGQIWHVANVTIPSNGVSQHSAAALKSRQCFGNRCLAHRRYAERPPDRQSLGIGWRGWLMVVVDHCPHQLVVFPKNVDSTLMYANIRIL